MKINAGDLFITMLNDGSFLLRYGDMDIDIVVPWDDWTEILDIMSKILKAAADAQKE